MRVLLTRALADAARTRAILEGLGHRVLLSPVIAIEATGASWPGGAVDALLATSGQAFAAIAEDWGPTLEARRLVPLWLVGQRTEEIARARGFLGSAHTAPHAVALAFEMVKRTDLGRVVYLAGRDRKPDIETALNVTDQHIEVIETYEATAADHLDGVAETALSEGRVDAVLHFSRRSAVVFADLATRATIEPHAVHVCLSNDVAAPLIELGWPAHVATEPTEASLIAALAAMGAT